MEWTEPVYLCIGKLSAVEVLWLVDSVWSTEVSCVDVCVYLLRVRCVLLLLIGLCCCGRTW